MHTNSKNYKEPLEYKPELHFMDEEGRLVKPKEFMPFGAGRRVCLGEELAKNELFLLVVGFLQKFEFKTVPDHEYSLGADPSADFKITPKPYELILNVRSN